MWDSAAGRRHGTLLSCNYPDRLPSLTPTCLTANRNRILHLIDTGGPGGAETIFLDLVRGLSDHGWDSTPVVPKRDWLDRAVRRVGFDPIVDAARRAFDSSYAWRLRRLVAEREIHLVQTHLLASSVYASIALSGTGVPVVCTFHGQPDIPSEGLLTAVKCRLLSRHWVHPVCVSASLRDHFVVNGRLPDRTLVIQNGVPMDGAGGSSGGETTLPDELRLSPDTLLLGAIGNVRPSKAYDVLLQAMALLKGIMPTVHLVIVGQTDNALGDELKSLREELGLESDVTFLGFRDDVSSVMAALDAYVLSSNDEGFSLALVQAMAAGLPVVATACGGPQEIIGSSKSVLLVEPGDIQGLAASMGRILSDRSLAAGLGRRARARARARFSVERMLRAYDALYRSLV